MRLYITGVGGLVGSAVAELAMARGMSVTGVDADYRGQWFGKDGSVSWRLEELQKMGATIIRDDFRRQIHELKGHDAIIHCASQPSHDFSRTNVVEDSAVNYMGTVELLEGYRTTIPNASFVFLSTNKVYGDRINTWNYTVEGLRYVLDEDNCHADGVTEDLSIDQSMHTPFGVSKLAADLMVQEYGACFGLKTVTLRCGCLTGKSGSPVELQGFLGYLVRCAVEGKPYTIYGHGGYQVRDNLAAEDLAEAILLCVKDHKERVYNMGGGPSNSLSVLEAIDYLKNKGLDFEVKNGPPRLADHKWWISNTRRFQRDHGWEPKKSVWSTIDEMVERKRSGRESETGDSTLSAGALEAARV